MKNACIFKFPRYNIFTVFDFVHEVRKMFTLVKNLNRYHLREVH